MRLKSPAKINLFLKIVGKRPNGYHELETLMCRVDLNDSIDLVIHPATPSIGPDLKPEIRVTCSDPHVPGDEANLAGRAARLFFHALPAAVRPVDRRIDIHIHKVIPVGAGLGGGSSNAASVLDALNRHYQQPFSPPQLAALGLKIGTDVPFFLFKKPALAAGTGELLRPFAHLNPWTILLVFPGFNVSTAEVYKNFKFGLTKGEKISKYSLFKDSDFDVEMDLTNDLESVTASKYPEIERLKEQLRKLGALSALMSGSGPTVFGIFRDRQTARTVQQTLEGRNRRLFVTKLLI